MADPRALFRAEAIEANAHLPRVGAPLRLTPRWIAATYWLLVATVAAGLLYTVLARVGEYAHGPAVVRVEGRLELTTAAGGVVMTVDARAGQTVAAGQVLVRFHTESEQQELAHLDREFELKLVRILLHPNDEATRQSLASLRAGRELAAARLRERQVVAPSAGVVRNLRVRPGQMIAAGDVVLTLVDEDQASYAVMALLPGQFRPMLRPGLPLRFELEGYPQVSSTVPIDAVDDGAVGPTEVRRALGQEIGDTLPAQGPLVMVRARLPRATFSFEGQRYRYYDGIPGRVDVRVRSMPLGALLFPFARLREGDHGR
jgi:multidrug efflux pump subunit AcrA (membrane-fusion protein)